MLCHDPISPPINFYVLSNCKNPDLRKCHNLHQLPHHINVGIFLNLLRCKGHSGRYGDMIYDTPLLSILPCLPLSLMFP